MILNCPWVQRVVCLSVWALHQAGDLDRCNLPVALWQLGEAPVVHFHIHWQRGSEGGGGRVDNAEIFAGSDQDGRAQNWVHQRGSSAQAEQFGDNVREGRLRWFWPCAQDGWWIYWTQDVKDWPLWRPPEGAVERRTGRRGDLRPNTYLEVYFGISFQLLPLCISILKKQRKSSLEFFKQQRQE